jgi:Tfp pilus assembly protein PilX
MLKTNTNKEKGIAMYLTLIVTVILLGIALGLSTIVIDRLGILKSVGESVLAFAAAEAGIEQVLLLDNRDCAGNPDPVACLQVAIPGGPVALSNGATYTLEVTAPGVGTCPGGVNYCAKSIGIYQSATRTIRVTR